MKPLIIRKVAAFRIIYKCGHRGTVVANAQGARAENSALKHAQGLTQIPCLECEMEERERLEFESEGAESR